jgi:type IV pilus assembly protein PilC
MATFEYNALTSAGRLMKGTIEAGSREEADELLKKMGLTINSVEKAKREKPKTAIGRDEFLLFNQQLASITKAGIPLERGLRELATEVSSTSMRKLINEIAGELERGTNIEEAFEKRQKAFPPLYGRILKAGVETGRLSEMLTSLNRHIEMTNRTRRIIFEALSYPAVVFTLGALIVTGVFLFIMPQFEVVLTEMLEGQGLNVITQSVFAISRNIIPFWIAAAFLVAVTLLILIMLSSSPAGRRFKESVFLRLPVAGSLYHSSILSKMAEAMAMTVAAGCDMPAALRYSSGASGCEKLVLESNVVAAQIEQGANTLEAGQFSKVIPRLFLYSIQLSTQRNELQDSLYSLGQMYAEQARCSQARLQAFLCPLILIVVGTFIFLAVLAMFLPMLQIVSGLSSGI